MADMCVTKTLDGVIVQENGLIRNCEGHLIGRLVEDILFSSPHLDASPKDNDAPAVDSQSMRRADEAGDRLIENALGEPRIISFQSAFEAGWTMYADSGLTDRLPEEMEKAWTHFRFELHSYSDLTPAATSQERGDG